MAKKAGKIYGTTDGVRDGMRDPNSQQRNTNGGNNN